MTFALGRLAPLLAAVAIAALATGCSSCRDESKAVAPASSAPAELGPVAEPAGLMAELVVPRPEATWRKLRALAGSRGALLAGSFPLLVAGLLELPHTAAGSIDTDVPLLGALVADGAELAWVVALHVKSGRELAASLTNGANASHDARVDAASGVLVLEPRARSAEHTALGVVGNYLLVAPRAPPLLAAGPFVARTLPGRPESAEPAVLSARQAMLKGPVVKQLRSAWRAHAAELKALDRSNRDRHGGRAPDFGDPLAALAGVDAAVEATIEVLESAREIRLVVDPRDDQLELRAALVPEGAGPAAELVQELDAADLAPLLALPGSTVVGVVTRSTRAQREASARSARERLAALFGERINAAEQAQVERTFGDLARGRGDVTAFGVIEHDGALALVMRGAVADAPALDAGLKSLLKLPRMRAFAEPARQFVGELAVQTSSASVPGVAGRVERATLKLKPARLELGGQPVSLEPQAFELLYHFDGSLVHAAAGRSAGAALAELVKPAGPTLEQDPVLGAAAKRAGAVSFAAVVRPLAFVEPAAKLDRSAPVLVVLGPKSPGAGLLRVIAARPVVEAVAGGAFDL